VARVPYVDVESCRDASLAQTFRAIGEVRGSVSNLFRLVAQCPAGLGPFFGLSTFVREGSSIHPRVREIAILVTAYRLDVPYEVAAHTVAGRAAGLTDQELSVLACGNDTGFSATERAVIHYATEVAHERTVSDFTFAELREQMSETQVVELALVVAWYHLVTAVVVPLHIDLDPELKGAFGNTDVRNG